MLTVRKNTFETNSSSTHCLCFSKDRSIVLDETALQEAMIIEPLTYEEIDEQMTFTTIREKLRYFLTVYEQSDFGGCKFMQMLQKLCPNVVFKHTFSTNKYVLEDAEWFFSYDKPESDNLTEVTLKNVLLTGTIYFGNRDNEHYSDKITAITRDDSMFSVSWSG